MKTPRNVYFFLLIGLLAASLSGNIIRLGQAGPVAIAAWRLGLAAIMLAPLAGRNLKILTQLTRNQYLLLTIAGTVLAFHFFAWIGAVQNTTVANAAIFFSVNPVITATAAWFIFRERPTVNLFISIGLGLIGLIILAGNDLSFNPDNLDGDFLAIICSILFTAYLLIGKKLRQTMPNTTYVTVVYGVAAIISFIILMLLGQPLIDYNRITWLCFFLMALLPTMLGHTSFNHAIKYIGAGRISAATLSEPLLAGLIAYFAWDEKITWQILAGYVFIAASVLLLLVDSIREES